MGMGRGVGKVSIGRRLRRGYGGNPRPSDALRAGENPAPSAGSGQAFSRTKRARNGAAGLASCDAKRRGELVEMMFMVKASQMGLMVAKPYGDSRRYDFITDAGRRLLRVQVKSSAYRMGRGWRVNATSRRHSRQVYTKKEIDFLIGYVVPRDAWYVVPVWELRTATFGVYPDGCRRGGKFEKYREAWELLGGRSVFG
jgi:PD-(D/E)XK endonuclease